MLDVRRYHTSLRWLVWRRFCRVGGTRLGTSRVRAWCVIPISLVCVVIVLVFVPVQIDCVEYHTGYGSSDVGESPDTMPRQVVGRHEGAHDQYRRIDDGCQDRRIGHGDDRRAIDNHSVELCLKMCQETLELVALQQLRWVGRNGTRGYDCQIRHIGRDRAGAAYVSDESGRHTDTGIGLENAVQTRTPEIAIN